MWCVFLFCGWGSMGKYVFASTLCKYDLRRGDLFVRVGPG